jgi:hypothetical protein
MKIINNTHAIQAFPISSGTYISPVGGMTGFDASGRMILHAAEDATVTFHFLGGTDLVVDLPVGSDIAIKGSVETIDSTGQVWIS